MAVKILNSTVVNDLTSGFLKDLTISDLLVLDYNAGVVTLQNVTLDQSVEFGTLDTDDLNEGTTNLYYTEARVNANFVTKTTSDLSEGTNLYYTEARVTSLIDSDVSDSNSALRLYVDAQDLSVANTAALDATNKSDTAEANANTYTDTRELAITSAYQSYANAAEADANTYTDTRELAITSAYQSYSDLSESSAIASAALDATAKADSAEADAIASAEAKDVARASTAVLYADQVETNANTYTDTQVTKTVIDALDIQAASVDTNSVALGTDTTGNYVATLAGTANEIEVTGSGSETSAVTVGLPTNVTVSNDLTVGGDLFVTGTTVSIGAANLSVDDSFIYLNQGDAIGVDNTIFTGTGLNDVTFEGYMEGSVTTTYYARIDSVGATDTFEWSKDNFTTTEATGIAITGGEQLLDNNIKFHATATTGHTLGDVWSGTAAPLAIDSGIFSNINTGASAPGYTHIGVFYDASALTWKVFSEYDPEPNGDINTGDASFVLGRMEADCFIANDVDINGTVINANHATNKLYVDTADTSAIATAALDATSKSLTAFTNANAYTDGRETAITTAYQLYADTAESAAIATAALDATSKANTAEADAIAAAALDATSKANTAEANAKSYSNARDITAASFNTTNGIVTFAKASGNVTVDLDGRYSLTDTVYNAGTGISIAGGIITNTSPDRTVSLSGTGATSVSGTYPNFTISSTNTNTTYSAGSGIALSGTTFSVAAGNGLTQTASGLAMSGAYTGNFTATGDVTAYSDRCLKRNIVNIPNALDKVAAMRGVMFEKDGVNSTGVIAQEVELVLPEVVHTDRDGMKSVAYGNITGLLIEAIKDQQKIIEDLQAQINDLKA